MNHPEPRITIDYTVVTPAYGRDYKSGKAATADFTGGKDFLLQSVNYGFDVPCSIRDFAPGVTVSVRYKNKTNIVNVKVPKR